MDPNIEADGKVKTKLLSMWNNMKYGWTVNLKTNFSKDAPVWLLGRCYHRKLEGALPEIPTSTSKAESLSLSEKHSSFGQCSLEVSPVQLNRELQQDDNLPKIKSKHKHYNPMCGAPETYKEQSNHHVLKRSLITKQQFFSYIKNNDTVKETKFIEQNRVPRGSRTVCEYNSEIGSTGTSHVHNSNIHSYNTDGSSASNGTDHDDSVFGKDELAVGKSSYSEIYDKGVKVLAKTFPAVVSDSSSYTKICCVSDREVSLLNNSSVESECTESSVMKEESDRLNLDLASGIEAFKSDFHSRIWLTYRRAFPILNGSSFTTDCGWGCMLRSGQMLLAQALVCHFLGRSWRWRTSSCEEGHRRLVRWFGDAPCTQSPLSLHSLVAVGQSLGKKPGDWYGPASVSYLLRQAVSAASKTITEFDQFKVYVAQDCTVYEHDIVDLCEVADTNGKMTWKALVLLVPVRLGTEKLNMMYAPCVKAVLTLESCIGIIGGRPRHSLYFVGWQEDKLIHLDPHYCQEIVDVWQTNFPLHSFHCKSPRKMPISKMDPSCCIGFYCRTRDDYLLLVSTVKEVLVPQTQVAEYPMFIFSEGRSRDVLFSPMNFKEEEPSDSCDDIVESEEFEFL